MKKTIFFVFLIMTIFSYSQKNSIDLSLSSGISTPSSGFSDNSYAGDGNFIELSGGYYFSSFGIGVSVGQFRNPTDSNFSDFTNSLDFSTVNTTEDWKTTYFGFGPEYKISFNKFETKFVVRTGLMSVKPTNIQSSFNENIDVSIPVYDQKTDETSKISYFSTAVKLGYRFTKNLSLFAVVDYLSAFSDELTILEGSKLKQLRDINKNGIIDAEDFIGADGTPLDFEITSKNVKPQTLNYGVGLNYIFDLHKREESIQKSNKTVKQEPKVEVRGWDSKDKKSTSKTRGTIQFKNPSKENKKEERKLITILPKNNSHFKSASEIEDFTWKLIGDKIPNPQYVIEIAKIGSNRQPQRTYIGTTSDSKIAAKKVAKFKAGKALAETVKRTDNSSNSGDNDADAGDGQYIWKVIETSTGISSNPSYFTMGNCEINFSISNDTIECLGYEGENRKFKICFDSTYSSSSGDLTFANPGSGLTVFDQSYTPLSYTLGSPNPVLITQVGASTTTVSYCFEVIVSASVTQIGFGLQGDDLDPSPILCQPGVGSNFEELPECICDECEEIELSFNNFNITPNGTSGNQFNFNGNINVNVPIYGIEFQIQSYSYSSNPSACSEGVSSVEESGMILMPGTTINNSTSLQLVNETISGSASSNNNATKNIKYTSSSALTGAIPVNLTIGLPGPISGLDPSCCVIDYTVCIKVKVFYDEGNCKSCVFTHCFNFNNQ